MIVSSYTKITGTFSCNLAHQASTYLRQIKAINEIQQQNATGFQVAERIICTAVKTYMYSFFMPVVQVAGVYIRLPLGISLITESLLQLL